MANTELNIFGDPIRVNQSFPTTSEPESVRLGLSSSKGSFSQIELSHQLTGRWRKKLRVRVTDATGEAEFYGREPASTEIVIGLGRSALLGRGRYSHGLEILNNSFVSKKHLRLGLEKNPDSDTGGYALTIHDKKSTNGSRIVDPSELPEWYERESASEPFVEPTAVTVDNEKPLFDGDKRFPGFEQAPEDVARHSLAAAMKHR